MAYTSLTYETDAGIGVVTFATPHRLNAIDAARLDDLEGVLDTAEADETLRALILTGAGDRAFCVGLDLELLDKAFADLDYFQQVVTRLSRIMARLEALPIPTLAAINGLTRAGGFELSLACDFVVVADEADYGDAHTNSGVLPAAATTRLNRRVGDQKAKALMWSARFLRGREAVDFGLAIASAPRARLLDVSRTLLGTMIDKPRAVIAASKDIMRRTAGMPIAEAVATELEAFGRYMRDEPYGREGYQSFREKRPPSWTLPDAS